MKKVFVLILGLIALTVFSGEFLMIYPNNTAMKGNSINVSTDGLTIDVPETWIRDSFSSTPYPSYFSHVVQKPYDYSQTLKNNVGKQLKWMDEDGTIRTYTLLLDEPILLSDSNGVFTPKSGTPLFSGVTIKKRENYLALKFDKDVEDVDFSYMFKGLSFNTYYSMELTDYSNEAIIKGTLMVLNSTTKDIETDRLFVFSGDINTLDTDYGMKEMRSVNYAMADSYGGGTASSENFEDYKIYSIKGSHLFKAGCSDYINFFNTVESYDKIYTFSTYYANRNSDFQPLDQTIKINKLSSPMMGGKVKMLKSDLEKQVFLGENSIANSSKGQSLEINFGKAYDLQGKVELIQSNKSGKTYIEAYKFTAKNYATEKKDIQLNFQIPRDSDVTVDIVKFSRPNATLLQIPLQVYPDSEVEVTFEIRYDR